MTALTLLCAALGVLALPLTSMPMLRLQGLQGTRRRRRLHIDLVVVLSRRWLTTAALAAVGCASGAIAGHLVDPQTGATLLAPAVAFGLVGALIGSMLAGAAMLRNNDRAVTAFVEATGALAAELRAGQSARHALRAAATTATEPATRRFFAAAARFGVAHHPGWPTGTAPPAGRSPGGRTGSRDRSNHTSRRKDIERNRALRAAVVALTAAWQVSERSGAAPADVIERVAADLRSRRQQQHQLSAQVSGARATAVLLAGLPLLGIVLGTALGAQPIQVLLGTQNGQAALLIGVAFEATGVLWTARIVRAAGGGG